MGKVLTIMNMKGGVGKTTVSIHIAGTIAAYNIDGKKRKSIAIDYDPQFNLSQAFIPADKYFKIEKERKTTLSILMDDESELDPYELQVSGNHTPPPLSKLIYPVYDFHNGQVKLDIIPSTLDLMYVALGQTDKKTKPMEERFAKTIEECRKNYDLTIIDCHPAGSIFTKTSLRNSDHVLIPVVADSSYAIRGIGLMLQFIESKKVGKYGPQPHILFNKTPRNGTSPQESSIRQNKQFGEYCMKNTLTQYKAFSEPEGGSGFVWWSRKPYSGEARTNIYNVTVELLNRIGA